MHKVILYNRPRIRHIGICLFGVCLSMAGYAQEAAAPYQTLSATQGAEEVQKETILIGDIIDEATGEAVAGANIYFRGTQTGTSSNEEGTFVLRTVLNRKRTLVISAVGYQTQRYPIEPGTMAGIQVALREKTAWVEEVVVLPGENPALPLIAEVRRHRHENDPTLRNASIPATQNTELFVSEIQRRHLQRSLWHSMQQGLLTAEDSTLLLPLYRSQGQVALQGSEVIPTGEQKAEALVLTANDYSALLTTQGNLSFYKNSFSLLGHSFLSPLSTAGATYYRYYLADSVPTSAGKTYQVDFRTRNPFYATFNGSLYIDSASYAIVGVDATVPAQSSVNYLSNLRIRQTLSPESGLLTEDIRVLLDFAVKTDTTHLFPTILLHRHLRATDTALHTVPTATTGMDTDSATAAFEALAATPVVRTAKWFATILTTGYIPTGTRLDIGHIEEILQINEHEGVHAGIPLRTNERLWKNVSLEASVGYGFRDQAWKGMGRVNINLPTLRRNILRIEYQDHYVWTEVDDFSRLLRENSIGWKTMDFTAYTFEALHSNKNTVNTATRQRQASLTAETDWSDNIETMLYLRAGRMGYGNPLAGYNAIPSFGYQTLGGILRVGFGERKIDMYFRRVHVHSKYPAIYLGAEAGSWQDAGQTTAYHIYSRLNLLVRQTLPLGAGGEIDWALQAGCVLGQVPYPLLHHTEGNQGYAYDPYRFTLMNNYQYAADRYVALHAEWNGQGVLFNLIPGIRYLRLRELVECKVAYGALSARNKALLPTYFTGIGNGTQTLQSGKAYAEIGVGIGNILRIADLYSVWRLTDRKDTTTPRWALRFRIHIGL